MSLFDILMLGQAVPQPEDVTSGQILSGMLILLVMASSLAMIVVWVTRIGQTGHAIPAAQRGILRVPILLTFTAVGLSLLMLTFLMLILMGLVSLDDRFLPPVVPNPAVAGSASEEDIEKSPSSVEKTEATTEEATTSEAASTTKETASASTAPAMAPSDMVHKLRQTVVMDLFLFLVFGFVIFISSGNGRVLLAEKVSYLRSASAGMIRNSAVFMTASPWPDLDDSPAIPQNHGYNSSPLTTDLKESPEPQSVVSDSPYAAPVDQSLSPETISVDHDAAVRKNAEEPFSFLTELRFAGEVFLAAYVPTAVLRIIIVLLTVGIMGEDPGQHPFLEMMKSGVGLEIIALILLTAVILAPIVEELQFRVVVLGGIAQLGRPMLALCLSSILFAFAHGFPDSLALLPLAFALGYTYLRRRSYITVMLVHFLFNGFNMILALLAML